MIINRRKLLSYRCPFCGSIQYKSFSIFEFQDDKILNKLCDCRKSAINANKDKNGRFTFEVPCIACGDTHKIKITNRNLWFSSINYILCDNTNTEIAYIGEYLEVHNKIDSYEKEIDDLITKLGYNDYFFNIRIMLEVLNRIHDLAEEGSLMCECGSTDVELTLLRDRVKIGCKECSAHTFAFARSNQDLVNLYDWRHIILCKKINIRETMEV